MPATAEQKKLLEELASYDESLAVDPMDADVLTDRGDVLFYLGRYDEALESYNESLSVRPEHASTLYHRGKVLFKLSRYDDALESCNESLSVRPGHARTLYQRGKALSKLGQYDDALDSYNESLSVRPEDASTLHHCGNVLYTLGCYDDALNCYNESLNVRPGHARTLYRLGNVLVDLGYYDEALDSYNVSLSVRPGHAETLHKRGDVLFDLGRYNAALKSYNESLNVEPEDAEVLASHGSVLNALGHHDAALQSLNKSLRLCPEDAHTLAAHGEALNGLGEPTVALNSFNESLNIRPGHARTLLHRGDALFDLDRYDEALDSYNESLQVEPENVETLTNHGNVLYVLGHYGDALQSLNKSLQLRPEHAFTLARFGSVLYSLDHYDEALENFNKALALEPDNAISLRYKKLTLKELSHSAQAAEPLSAEQEESKDEEQEKPFTTLDPFPTYSLELKPQNYLLLDEIPAGAYYVIGTPALKSSGDIYQIAPYLALAKKLGHNLPIVLLAHDETEATKKQAKLAADFVCLFGLDETTVKTRQVKSTYRPASRTAGLRTYVADQSPICYFIDQKAVTLFLATLFQQHGFAKMSRDFREALLDATTETRRQYSNETRLLDRWVEARFNEIKKAAAGRPIVLLNRRLACGSNSEHDIDENGWKQIEACLKAKNIFYWYLVAASNPGSIPTADKNKTFLFQHDTTIGTRNVNAELDAKGFYKLRHVLLLAKLLELPQLVGMAGNTSGTLDMAALLGYWTYSFHNFTNTSGVAYLDAQDYRILMQHPFLSIGFRPQAGIGLTNDESKDFTTWLENKEKDTLFPALPGRTIKITTRGKPYDQRDCRLPFSGALTWKKAGDTRDLTHFPRVTIQTEGEKLPGTRHIKFKFFDKMDQCLVRKLALANQNQKKRETAASLPKLENLTVSPPLPPTGLNFFSSTSPQQFFPTPAGTPPSFSPSALARHSRSSDNSSPQTPAVQHRLGSGSSSSGGNT